MSAYAVENRRRRWFTGEEHTNMKLTIPSNAEKILHILEENGYEAYVVGGCVRDSILGRTPDDWDITTSASPEQVKELFHRTVDTGLQHGTVTVLMDKEGYEVTTYRVDGDYEDGRHPKQVMFTSSLEEDLKRRDFTINAMAYHPVRGLVDLFHGMEDMQAKIIRCVGNPMERFHEDALRILRAVRFSAQLGFTIEKETKNGIRVLAPNLKCVSAERIQTELVKLLVSPHPDYLRVAYETGITKEFLPEFDRCMDIVAAHKNIFTDISGAYETGTEYGADVDNAIALFKHATDRHPECYTRMLYGTDFCPPISLGQLDEYDYSLDKMFPPETHEDICFNNALRAFPRLKDYIK